MLFCPPLILGIWFVWSIQHLVQQNIGILLLYHNARANEVVVNRKTETLSVQVSAVLFSLLFIRRDTLQNQSVLLLDVAIGVIALWTVLLKKTNLGMQRVLSAMDAFYRMLCKHVDNSSSRLFSDPLSRRSHAAIVGDDQKPLSLLRGVHNVSPN